jgi:hypothetical protein
MGTPAKPGTTPSLPGANSTRTDGPGSVASKQAIRYAAGEPGAEEFANLQGQAAMPETPDVKGLAPSQIEAAAAKGKQPQQQAQDQGTPMLPSLTGLTARPWEDETTPHTAPQQADPRTLENNALIARYLPDLQAAKNIPGVPDSWHTFVNYLARQISQ